jgi:hypothetical protein
VTRDQFYSGKSVILTEWWLHDCDLPALTWARLRVFDDGTSDASWEEGGTLYGFDSQEYAGLFLAEDEYIRFDRMDAEDEREHGLRLSDIAPPTWADRPAQPFEYLGTY